MLNRSLGLLYVLALVFFATPGVWAEPSVAERARHRIYEGGVDEQALRVQPSSYFDQERRFHAIELSRRPAAAEEPPTKTQKRKPNSSEENGEGAEVPSAE